MSEASRSLVSLLLLPILALSLAEETAAAEPEAPPEEATCEDVRAEVSIHPVGRDTDVWTQVVEESFEIALEIRNGCEREITVSAGEIVPYRTNLEPVVADALQPRECLEGHVSAVGAVGPGQVLRRMHLVERCLSLVDAQRTRKVEIDGGVLDTSGGPTRFAPVVLDLR